MIQNDSDTVYVTVGRGCGKTSRLLKYYEELIKSGKKVVVIEPKYASKHIEGKPVADIFVDRDVLTPERMKRAEEILSMFLKGEKNG